MDFLEPWMPVGPRADRLQRELASELGAGHQLKGRDMRAVAVRQDCDDVLFVSADEPKLVAVVHLTYQHEFDPRWPTTKVFASVEDWIERGMKQDYDDATCDFKW
jgi:hypothetical protein